MLWEMYLPLIVSVVCIAEAKQLSGTEDEEMCYQCVRVCRLCISSLNLHQDVSCWLTAMWVGAGNGGLPGAVRSMAMLCLLPTGCDKWLWDRGKAKRDALSQVKVVLWHSGLDCACAVLGIEADLKKPWLAPITLLDLDHSPHQLGHSPLGCSKCSSSQCQTQDLAAGARRLGKGIHGRTSRSPEIPAALALGFCVGLSFAFSSCKMNWAPYRKDWLEGFCLFSFH